MVTPTESQCKKRESWDLKEVEAKQDLRNQECMMRTMGQIIAPATVLETPRNCCVIRLGQHFKGIMKQTEKIWRAGQSFTKSRRLRCDNELETEQLHDDTVPCGFWVGNGFRNGEKSWQILRFNQEWK